MLIDLYPVNGELYAHPLMGKKWHSKKNKKPSIFFTFPPIKYVSNLFQLQNAGPLVFMNEKIW